MKQFFSYRQVLGWERKIIKVAGLVMLLLAGFSGVSAQNKGKVPNDLSTITTMLDNKIPEQVKVLGVGNITPFGKESFELCTGIITYLVDQKGFRNVAIIQDDWLLRPLNDYLEDKRPFDATITDSLVRLTMANLFIRSASFSSLVVWLKKYNLAHRNAMVSLSGVATDESIPPAYFLIAYILPVDRVNGLALSKKWGARIYDYNLAYDDIGAWYQQISHNPALFNKHKTLLVRCGEDIRHNEITRKKAPPTMSASQLVAQKTQLITELIQKRGEKKTIFFSNNEDVAKSEFTFLGDTLVSAGLLLHKQLGDKYFACLTDFSDSSSLKMIDNEVGELVSKALPGATQFSMLPGKKPVLFMKENYAQLKDYQPRTIFPVIGFEREILSHNTVPVTDALFILKNVTAVELLKRVSMSY